MATYTDNYALVKPTYGELADVAVINENMDTIDGIMHSNRTMLAPAFSQTEDYAEGDVVVYEGNLYRFIVPHTAGNWDGTEVEQTTLGEELSTKGGADVTKTASGNPIEITDGASAPLVKCVTEIQGSQDLHGYDKPWVGGAGKNKLHVDATSKTIQGVTYTVESDGEVKCNGLSSDSNFAWIHICSNEEFNKLGLVSGQSYILNGNVNPTKGLLYIETTNNIHMYEDTGSGVQFTYNGETNWRVSYVANFSTNFNNELIAKPMIRLSTESDPTFAPYSNICPITAYTEGEIEVRGKNLFGDVLSNSGADFANGEFVNTDTDTFANFRPKIFLYKDGNAVYQLSMDAITSKGLYTANIGYGNASYDEMQFKHNGSVRDLSVNVKLDASGVLALSFYCESFNPTTVGGIVIKDIQVEKGSATTYEPYTSTYPSAIYRGSEDVVNGTVECEVKYFTPTTWSRNADHSYYTREFMTELASTGNVPCICDKLKEWDGEEPTTNYGICFVNSAGAIRINTVNAYASVEDMVADMGEMHFACTLPTPQTSSVTPTNLPIKSLSGYNHIESSTGDMEVEYITSEYQPIVDLIQSNKHVYSTAEQVVGTWVDGKTVYEKTVSFTVPSNNYETETTGITNYGKCVGYSGIVEYSNGMVEDINYSRHDSSLSTFYVAILADGNIFFKTYESVNATAYITIRYTKSTPTRSLNLTRSAVEEIPEEIKNAPFEEKPETNEADDDAPTEVDER